MTKKEFIRAVADRQGTSLFHVKHILDGIVAVIGEQMREGNEVRIQGFGQFYSADRKAMKDPMANNHDMKTVKQMKFRPFTIMRKIINE